MSLNLARQRRRKVTEEAENHERWMVSYADFITLLFAFFVVMYSISSVNQGKYRVLTDSLGQAFALGSDKEQPHQGNNVIALDAQGNIEIQPIKLDIPAPDQQTNALSEEIVKERQQLKAVSEQFEAVLSDFIEQKLVDVKKHDFWIELEMNSELLFSSGESELSKQALPILTKVAEVVRVLPNMVNVEGYTDNIPINTLKFPSNWDLASARATSVVRALINEGVDPARLSAVGYGEFHPVADNQTEAGRFKNRRVILLLMSRVVSRYGANDQERARLLNLETNPELPQPLGMLNRQAHEALTSTHDQLPGAYASQFAQKLPNAK